MPFWSGETLKTRLDLLKLVEPFDPKLIDCAAYTLRIGPEIFVTSDQNKGDAKDGVKIPLGDDEPFKIPPGQFAFLLSEERVKVPSNALAFISFKTSQKWLGLVNVSGFHVDPGWDGNLMFGVYNAGPGPVHLRRGMPMFLIWYADLDRISTETYQPDGEKGTRRIPEKYVNTMSGQVFSPMVLASELNDLEKEVQSLKERFELIRAILIGAVIAVVGVLLIPWIRDQWQSRQHHGPESNAVQVQPQLPTPESNAPRRERDQAPQQLLRKQPAPAPPAKSSTQDATQPKTDSKSDS